MSTLVNKADQNLLNYFTFICIFCSNVVVINTRAAIKLISRSLCFSFTAAVVSIKIKLKLNIYKVCFICVTTALCEQVANSQLNTIMVIQLFTQKKTVTICGINKTPLQ